METFKSYLKSLDFYLIIFLLLFFSFGMFNWIVNDSFFVGSDMASTLNSITEIGSHELEQWYIMKPILEDGFIKINFFIIISYYISITYTGYKITFFFLQLINKINIFDRFNIFFFFSGFVVGSLVFVGILRILSLNFTIGMTNLFVVVFSIINLIFFIREFFFINKIQKKNFILCVLLFFLFLVLNIQNAGHHLVGDSFYHYSYMSLIQNFLSLDYIPIIGSHYFEAILVTPIVFILQDYFFYFTFEQSVFLSVWVLQVFSKMSSLLLIYFFFKFFIKNNLVILIFLIFLFFSNHSAHFFVNPLLYDSGNPLALSLHGSRSVGVASFLLLSYIFFNFIYQDLFNFKKIKTKIYTLTILFFLMIGISSLGIQFSFIFIIFFSFFFLVFFMFLLKYKIFNFFISKINSYFILVSIFIILSSYTYIGFNMPITHISAYLMFFLFIFSLVFYYSNFFNISNYNYRKGFPILYSSLFFLFFALCFLGNFLTYKLLIVENNFLASYFTYISNIFSYISHAHLDVKNTGLYNELITYNALNEYTLMNICSLKDKIEYFMTGMPNYHCSSLTKLIYGSGIFFLLFSYNCITFFNIDNIKTIKKNCVEFKYIYFLFLLSTVMYIFSLFFADMISGSYLIHSRTRFNELANNLVIINFILIFTYKLNTNYILKKIIIILFIIKIILPFFMNLPLGSNTNFIFNNWYIAQFLTNLKYLSLNLF